MGLPGSWCSMPSTARRVRTSWKRWSRRTCIRTPFGSAPSVLWVHSSSYPPRVELLGWKILLSKPSIGWACGRTRLGRRTRFPLSWLDWCSSMVAPRTLESVCDEYQERFGWSDTDLVAHLLNLLKGHLTVPELVRYLEQYADTT